ncbi:hypothetical protein AB4Y44_09945 [Paraburkholderia sp. BR10937]|uniref:hypothetical protein n=1 Tax=Paraburkholderia sp. BR10937 TaxID=3236994 RepID=UPI0034D32258
MASSIFTRSVEHVTLIRFQRADGTEKVAFRDRDHRLMKEPTDYVDLIRREAERSKKTATAIKSAVDAALYALKDLHTSMSKLHLELSDLDDNHLQKFRNHWLDATMRRSNSRGNAMRAKQTTNVKLRIAYAYLDWCQQTGRVPPDTIGWIGCRIRSSLPSVGTSQVPAVYTDSHKHPLVFKGIGERSRRGRRQHWATADEIADVETWLSDNENPHAWQRDQLLIRVIDAMAWRAGTVLGLTIDDFSAERIKEAERRHAAIFHVEPVVQKGGHSLTFSLPWALTYRIADYINGENGRVALMKEAGATEKVARRRVFLASNTGAPLKRSGLSSRLSSVFKAAGFPVGAGVHSIRRGTAKREARADIEFRQRNGLSTAPEDITEGLAEKLGHTSHFAQRAYLESVADKRLLSVEEQLAQQLDEEKAKNAALSAQVATLQDFLLSSQARTSRTVRMSKFGTQRTSPRPSHPATLIHRSAFESRTS